MTGKMKKFLSVFVAMLIGTTVIGGINVFADNGDTYTASYGGVSSVNFNGNSEGIAEIAVSTTGKNYVAYCIDLKHYVYNGTTYYPSDAYDTPDPDYVSLNAEQQMWLDYAMMYGYSGTTRYGTSGGEEWDEYQATQCLSWMIMEGYFGGEQESATESGIADAMLGTLSSGSNARSVYEAIRANMVKYEVSSKEIPSFASSTAAGAPQYVLNYNRNDGKFELTLTDTSTDSILQYFNFAGSSGITVAQSGSEVTLSSGAPVTTPVTLSATSTFQPSDVLEGAQDGMPIYWIKSDAANDYQTLVSFDPSRHNTPASAYISVKTQDVGSIRIEKTSGDGVKGGFVFEIKQGGTVVATTEPTDSEGVTTVDNLPVGTYMVSEKDVPGKYIAPADQNDVSVTTGETTTLQFNNALKMGSIKIVKTAGDNQVTGIVFDITKDDGTYSTTATTGTDGTVTAGGLPIGTYTVKEDSVAGRYVDPGSQDVTVNQDTADNIVTTVVHFDNVLKTGSIKIVKTAGDNQVTGIVFDITKDDGTYSTTATTGTDGTVTVGGLPIGTYTVKEDSVADRYVDPGSQDVTVNQDTADNIVTTVVHFDNVLKTTSIPDQGVPGSPGTGTTITDNNTPKGSNPNTGDHSGSVPLAAAAALSSLVALAGITLGIKIKRRRKA